jgi:hypothetical protein
MTSPFSSRQMITPNVKKNEKCHRILFLKPATHSKILAVLRENITPD